MPEGEGEILPEGEGEVSVEGEGEILSEGEGEPSLEGEGEPPAGLQITADPTEFVMSEGDSVTFVINVTGAQGALSYQWYRVIEPGTPTVIPDANDSSFSLTDIVLEDGGRYQCEVYDNVLDETAWSPVFHLVVTNGIPVAGLTGLALIGVLTAFAGAVSLRKKE